MKYGISVLFSHDLQTMELSLSERDPFNAVFLNPDGAAVYHTDTPFAFFSTRKTTINKISREGPYQMGLVEVHDWNESIVSVWGRPFIPYRSHTFSNSEVFTASDNRSYKWKDDWGGQLILHPDDGSDTIIAMYDSGSIGIFSKSRPPTLAILPNGVHIMDEIVATFIYMAEKKRRRARRRRRRAMN
ncbi:hypothetical protein K435DRAFT_960143 [Dendrothele bispora CBS 962.96]|uniref:DUF6593 domain-containing protein n=1 Tax=Dendrothele bispora (strain CBS 962.96) TaxID=1314807 RepID=A0A4S8MUF1_DENBC|nr:hypothetical protein K435DRAFT_960143 [Dendrothele bispora CBS 962.96]